MSLISDLFDQAEAKRDVEHIYNLLRVRGLTSDVPDQFQVLWQELPGLDAHGDAFERAYRAIANLDEPLLLLLNVLRLPRAVS